MKQVLKKKIALLAAFAMVLNCLLGIQGNWLLRANEAIDYISPEVNTSSVTFRYATTTGSVVKVSGSYKGEGWATSEDWEELTYNEDSKVYECTVNDLKDGTYDYAFKINDAIEGDPKNPPKEGKEYSSFTIGEKAPMDTKSPIISGKNITLNFYDEASYNDPEKYVNVCGTIPGTTWNPGKTSALVMERSSVAGWWTININDVDPGSYQYKFVVMPGSGWTPDPQNPVSVGNDKNSVAFVPGLVGTTVSTGANTTYELPKLSLYEEGNSEATEVEADSFTLDQQVEGVTLDGKKLIIADNVNAEVILTANYKGQTAKVIVTIGTVYKYTIHYYEENGTYTDRGLWLWAEGGAAGKFYPFNEGGYKDSLGRQWATAIYSFSSTELNAIVRATDEAGAWDAYKDVEHSKGNKNALPVGKFTTEAEVWLMAGDEKTYTTEPGTAQDNSRTVIIEVSKPEKDYNEWEVYSWTTKKGTIHVPLTQKDEVGVSVLPIGNSTDTFSFIIPNIESTSLATWVKDIDSDRAISTPLDQRVIKARVTFGNTNIEMVPYNIGYELDPSNHAINFYYRDDDLFKDYELESLQSVKVSVNGTLYDMTYNAQNERYEFVFDQAETNTEYLYEYVVVDKDGNTSTVVDKFNENQKDGKSVVAYKELQAAVGASIAPESIDYSQNAVLTVDAKFEDVEDQKSVIKKAYADLTSVGGPSRVEIDPELMEVTIAVSDDTVAGEKQIPITIVDVFNKKHTASATLNVKTRIAAGNDFDWDEAVIYFMETDRFYDGDKSNNEPFLSEGVQDYDVNDPGKYHGGDLKGVTEKLDYLKELGINTIWISPIVENVHQNVYGDNDYTSYYGYHGYWALNFEKLNPHLGSIEDLHNLIDEAHERGIRIMVDVVLNHAGYDLRTVDPARAGRPGLPTDEDKARFEGVFRDPSLNDESSLIVRDQDQMPDIATENPEARAKIINWQTEWVSKLAKTSKGNTIDYFRVDTVKHVEKTTWNAFKNELTKINPSFKMIGEYYGAGYSNDFGYLKSGTMDSLLDFGFKDTAKQFVNGNIESAEATLESRNAVLDNTATYGHFLGSHDIDGFLLAELGGDEGKFKVATSLQLTAKGQPVIYYGEEIGLSGRNDYPVQTNRYDFDWSIANDDNAILTHYKKILAARNAYSEVFAKGDREKVAGGDSDGYLVVKRTYNGKSVLVAFNNGEEKEVTVKLNQSLNKKLTDLYSGAVYKTNNGEITFTLPAAADGGTVIIPLKKKSSSSSTPSTPSSEPSTGGGSGSSTTTEPTTAPTAAPTVEPTTEPTAEPVSAGNFADIENSWAKEYINILVEKGIAKGVDETHFAPQAQVSRAEFATFICRALNLETQGVQSSFKDVKDNDWFNQYVAAVEKAGLIGGYGDNTFGPNDKISRQEMIVILIRAYEYMTGKEIQVDDGAALSFKDQSNIAPWALSSIQKAVALGLVTGDENNQFNPNNNATRAEVAKVIVSILDAQEKTKSETTEAK